MEKFISGKEASKILGVHQKTLYNWDKLGHIETIRTPGNKRLYNIKKFIQERTKKNLKLEPIEAKLNLCYIRVSSNSQRNDLERQKEYMKQRYPTYKIIEDIGSEINFNKRGIKNIIKLAINGKINELVVAYKDRLTRFGFELIEDLIQTYSDGKIIVINKKEKVEPEEELVKDVMQLMNVFIARMNGLRKYKNKQK